MTPTAEQLADKDAIRELLARYCLLHAAHDFSGVAALFTETGRFENIVGSFEGRAQIQRLYESINPDKAAQLERKHYTTDVTISLDGDRAHAISQFLLVRDCATGMMVAAAGRYEDLLLRCHDGWRFERRKVHVDFHSDMGLKKETA